ncbi:cholesterol 24-hydroxylase-like, partial [Brachionus plicatilis]
DVICVGNIVDEVFGAGELNLIANNRLNNAILCPTNVDSMEINEVILHRDTGLVDDNSDFPIENAFALTPQVFPPHQLNAKVGSIVMMMKNWSVAEGICNGTRLIVVECNLNSIKCVLYLLRQKYSHIPGPKTNGLLGFYLGNIPELKELVKLKMVPDILTDWVKEYGPCFKYQILDKISIFTISPDAIKEMYIDKNFPKHPDIYAVLGFPYGSRYMGTSLVTSLDNVKHRHRRHIMNPAFSRQALNGFMDEFNTKSDVLMGKLRNLADGRTSIRMLDELNNLTLDVIAAACFGIQNDSITKENNLKKFVFESLKGLNRLLFNPTIKAIHFY